MFHDSSISEGESPCCFVSEPELEFIPQIAVSYGWALEAPLLAVEVVRRLSLT